MLWDKQDYETKRQHCFFTVYLNSDTRNYAEFYRNFEKYYKDYVEKHENDTKALTLPTYNTFKDWYVKNLWTERTKAYDKHRQDEVTNEIMNLAIKDSVNQYNDYNHLESKLLELARKKVESVDETLSSKDAFAIESVMKSAKISQENKRLISGESTENKNITADVKQEVVLDSFEDLESYNHDTLFEDSD